MNHIGIDFSINKTGITILRPNDTTPKFILITKNFKPSHISLYEKAGVLVYNREHVKLPDNSSATDHFADSLTDAALLADSIYEAIKFHTNPYVESQIFIEGLSFASTGNVALTLAGYRYTMLYKMKDKVPFRNVNTFSPITIKKFASSSMGKDKINKDEIKDKKFMINSFIEIGPNSLFRDRLVDNTLTAKTNYIPGVDDIVDSYWVMQTGLDKERDTQKKSATSTHTSQTR